MSDEFVEDERIDGTQRALWVSVLCLRGHYLRPFSRETFLLFKGFSSVRLSASSKGVFLKFNIALLYCGIFYLAG